MPGKSSNDTLASIGATKGKDRNHDSNDVRDGCPPRGRAGVLKKRRLRERGQGGANFAMQGNSSLSEAERSSDDGGEDDYDLTEHEENDTVEADIRHDALDYLRKSAAEASGSGIGNEIPALQNDTLTPMQSPS